MGCGPIGQPFHWAWIFWRQAEGPRQLNRYGRQSVDNANFDVVLGSASSLERSHFCEDSG